MRIANFAIKMAHWHWHWHWQFNV